MDFHITPTKNGWWRLTCNGIELFTTRLKKDVIDFWDTSNYSGRLYIHKKDGTIQNRINKQSEATLNEE